jgi:hypothetical protein
MHLIKIAKKKGGEVRLPKQTKTHTYTHAPSGTVKNINTRLIPLFFPHTIKSPNFVCTCVCACKHVRGFMRVVRAYKHRIA